MDLDTTSNSTSGANSGSSNGYDNNNIDNNDYEENNTSSGYDTALSNQSDDDDHQEDEGEGNSEDESTSSNSSVPPSRPPPPEEYLEEDDGESALLAAPRNHSYLPGVTQPLYPMELYQQRHNRQRHVVDTTTKNGDCHISNNECNNHNSTTINMDLAVLEMNPGVFLFPGATIPLRLRHPDWVRYLNHRIDRARRWEGDDDDNNDNNNGNGGVEKDAIAIGILTSKTTNGVTTEEEEEEEDVLIGRIGTIAIITSISEQDQHDDQTNHNNNNNNGRQEIAMTALGTCKFRILSRVTFDGTRYDDTPTPQQAQLLHIHRRRRRHYYDRFAGDSMAEKHMFRVQVMDEDEPSLPPPYLRSRHIMYRTNNDDNDNDNQHAHDSSQQQQLLHHLSKVSSIPKHAWELTWPWKLVSQIQSSISSSSKWHGLQQPPSNNNNHHNHNPGSFSYRMAINLPTLFSEEEKFTLLETSCVITRLRLILQKIKEENEREHRRSICCKNCGQIISYLGDMFTVHGADGTAGAYVNEHGIIHQTITLRNVINQNIRLYGTPQTKDSWFPGYSWTIANCNLCHNHLGWKFLPVHPPPKPNTSPNDHPHDHRMRRRRRLSSTTIPTSNNHGSTTATTTTREEDPSQEEEEEEMTCFWGISASNVRSSSEKTQDRNNNNNNNQDAASLRRNRYREVHQLLFALSGQDLPIRLRVHGLNEDDNEDDDDNEDEEVVHVDFDDENESEGDDTEEDQVI